MFSIISLLVILIIFGLILGFFFVKNRANPAIKWGDSLARGVKDLGTAYEAKSWLEELRTTLDLEENDYLSTVVDKFYDVGATKVEVCLAAEVDQETSRQIEALIIYLPQEEKKRTQILELFNAISSQAESDIKQEMLIYWLPEAQ